jgi:hypothetical protein
MKSLFNFGIVQSTAYLRELGVVDRTIMFLCQCILRWKNTESDLYDAAACEHLNCSQHR